MPFLQCSLAVYAGILCPNCCLLMLTSYRCGCMPHYGEGSVALSSLVPHTCQVLYSHSSLGSFHLPISHLNLCELVLSWANICFSFYLMFIFRYSCTLILHGGWICLWNTNVFSLHLPSCNKPVGWFSAPFFSGYLSSTIFQLLNIFLLLHKAFLLILVESSFSVCFGHSLLVHNQPPYCFPFQWL